MQIGRDPGVMPPGFAVPVDPPEDAQFRDNQPGSAQRFDATQDRK